MRTRSRTISRLMPFPRTKLPAIGLAAFALVAVLAGCQPGSNPRAVPSVAQISGDLKCASGDHGYEDQQAAWGFCYPGTWKFQPPRAQSNLNPPGLDLTFDITDVPCSSPPAGSSAQPECSPNAGAFGYMIVSTYERGTSTSLSAWLQSNLAKRETVDQTISWGNSIEAAKLTDGKRIALTPHQVVILDLHSGLLNLEALMSTRLDTWKFNY
jgi:hypothetical protein